MFSLIQVPVGAMMTFLLSYSIRRVMTQFFVMQMEAEKTRDSVTQILDNLPDAVIMLESHKLQYCNKQADKFFGVDLSHLSQNPENQTTLQSAQYLIMQNRCMYELQTKQLKQAAEIMEMENNESSIMMTDLGKSVLTLNEVVQLFEVESVMYNIKLQDDEQAIRTVILKKSKVEVNGEN